MNNPDIFFLRCVGIYGYLLLELECSLDEGLKLKLKCEDWRQFYSLEGMLPTLDGVTFPLKERAYTLDVSKVVRNVLDPT